MDFLWENKERIWGASDLCVESMTGRLNSGPKAHMQPRLQKHVVIPPVPPRTQSQNEYPHLNKLTQEEEKQVLSYHKQQMS